jgi:Asp-tRNA(Asn)/Glu-tRNA(Gln) amidotransferase A subunit family amidase
MTDTVFADACALAAAIRRGDESAREAVDRVLDRIARLDGDHNAYALVDADGARTAADRADAKQALGAPPTARMPNRRWAAISARCTAYRFP